MPTPVPKRDTTPTNHRSSRAGVCCLEREFLGQENKPPVKLVVFDCDETLTLTTLMPNDRTFGMHIGWSECVPEFVSGVNFESPFVDVGRIEMLKSLLSDLKGEHGSERVLAVLTRNVRGPIACLNLLMLAGLSNFFSAVWALPAKGKSPNGAYNLGSPHGENDWRAFSPPVAASKDHKADVLVAVTENVESWFPQLSHGVALHSLKDLRLENIVLVDDVRTNFQSPFETEAKLLRYCKVARYDANLPQLGLVQNMGGIGAKTLSDYDALKDFVNKPWDHRATRELKCMEREINCFEKFAVHLIMFEFDETLSLCTFVNEDSRFSMEIGYLGANSMVIQQYSLYNFESPYVEGSRVEKLDSLLQALGHNRVLAILTENSKGAVAVLNLLKLAGLAKHFTAIWAPSAESDQLCTGVYQEQGEWKQFACPAGRVEGKSHRAQMIHMIVDSPDDWFPQLRDPPPTLSALRQLAPEHVVVVDNARTNFIASCERNSVPRYCRVAVYDGECRDQGFMINMGGIGAHTDIDYAVLLDFVERPFSCRVTDPGKSLVGQPTVDGMTKAKPVGEKVLESTEPTDAKARPTGMRMSDFVDDKRLWIAAASAGTGAAVMGTIGAASGTVAGGATGAVLGIVPAFFTFGLSIPLCAAVGGSVGFCAGATAGATAGFVGGGTAGFIGATYGGPKTAFNFAKNKAMSVLNSNGGSSE